MQYLIEFRNGMTMEVPESYSLRTLKWVAGPIRRVWRLEGSGPVRVL